MVLSKTIMSPNKPSAGPNENTVTSESKIYYRSAAAVLTCIKWQKMMVITNTFQALNAGLLEKRPGVERHEGNI